MPVKKFIRFLVILLTIGLVIAGVLLALRNPWLQTKLANKVVASLTKHYDGKVSVGGVFIRWPNRIEVSRVLILDPINDTLLYLPEVKASVKRLNLDKRSLSLGRLTVREPVVRLRQLPWGEMNYQQLVDGFASKDTVKSSKPFILKLDHLRLNGGNLLYRTYGSAPTPGQVNPEMISVSGMEVGISKINVSETISFEVDLFTFIEQSGFYLSDLTGSFSLVDGLIQGEDVDLLTGNTRLRVSEAMVTLAPELRFQAMVDPGTFVGPDDLRFFTGISLGTGSPLLLNGSYAGTSTSIAARGAKINWSGLLLFDGDLLFDYRGDILKSGFNLVTRNLSVFPSAVFRDLLSGQIPGVSIVVPEFVHKLGTIQYQGKLTGTPDDLMSNGKFLLTAGTFETDLRVIKIPDSPGYNFQGQVAAVEFNPDEWIEATTGFSDLDFNLMVDGSWDGAKSVDASLDGRLSRFTLNGYRFRDLDIRGLVLGSHYEAMVALNDPNINLKLQGKADLSNSEPEFDFDLVVEGADLVALNLDRRESVSRVDLNLKGQLTGRNLNEINGEILIVNSIYENSRGMLPILELMISSEADLGRRKLTLSSEDLEARGIGDIHAVDLPMEAANLISRFIPAMAKKEIDPGVGQNDFSFNIHLKNPGPVTDILTPGFLCKDNSRISGSYSSASRSIFLEGTSPQFVVGGSQFTNLVFRLESGADQLDLSGTLSKWQIDRNTYFEDVLLATSITDNIMDAGLSWENSSGFTNAGAITCQALFEQTEEGTLATHFSFPASEINFRDSLWEINPFNLILRDGTIAFEQFMLSHKQESVRVNGTISDNPADTLSLSFNHLNLKNINQVTQSESFEFGGNLSGTAKLFNLKSKGMFLADMAIDSLVINGESLGHTTISSRSNGSGEPVFMDLIARRGEINTIDLRGAFNPVSDSMDFSLALDKLRLNLANPFVAPDLQDIRGLGTGTIRITGTPKRPELNGSLMMQKASFLVDYLNTRFFFTHKLEITPYAFWVTDLDMQDVEGHHALVNGGVRHDHLKDIRFDFGLDLQDFLLINTTEERNDGYWGQAYATGSGKITGELPNLVFDIRARTAPKTRFYIPVSVAGEAREIDFITYVEPPEDNEDADLLDFTGERGRRKDYEVNFRGVSIGLDLEVTPEAEVQLIFDSKVGDVIRGRGSGNLRIGVTPTTALSLIGDFTLSEGDYQLTLQNMPVKRFDIEPGGTIKWTGDVANAQLDIDAVYRTKAALYDLLQDESNTDLAQRIPVECHLLMTGFLESPGIRFNIVLPPNSNELARSQLQNLTEEDVNKQVISLLILGRFMPLQGFASGTSRSYESAGISTTTEVLSNQLNYWLSQISNDVNIGLNYRAGDELTSDEVEVALSTQLLNDRMTINVNGNYDVRQTNANANQLVGDVEVEYKISPSGKLRVKAFTRANDHLLYEYAPYTQGVGLFYREEFNSFAELFGKYWDRLTRKEP